MSADRLEQNSHHRKFIYLFLKRLWGKYLAAILWGLCSRHELSSWTSDDDWGKLGHQSSARTRLLNRSHHLSANTFSQLPCCIYITEECCYGNLLWWLFDVTCLRRGNRVASVLSHWKMCKCVHLVALVSFPLSCSDGHLLFHANILACSLFLCKTCDVLEIWFKQEP